MKKIALLLAVIVYAASLTGCGCCRRVRGTLCRGAFCGTRSAPILTPVRAPAPVPVAIGQQLPIVAAPQIVRPPAYQPQVIYAPQSQTCAPACAPVCAPACECSPSNYGGWNSGYQGDCGCSNYGGYQGDCGCSNYGGYEGDAGCSSCGKAPYGISVPEGEYLGEIQGGSDAGWEEVPAEAPAEASETDPGPDA